MKKILLTFLLFPKIAFASAPPLAFPDAQGVGKDKVSYLDTGFKVCIVDTCGSDTGGSPVAVNAFKHTGTLRQCLEGMTGKRAVFFNGTCDIATASQIIITDANKDVAIFGQTAPVRITSAAFNFDVGGYDQRTVHPYRWTSGNFGAFYLRIRPLRNTGTALNSANYSQKGGAIVIEDIQGYQLAYNSFSHCNDDCIVAQGNTATGNGYSDSGTIQLNAWGRNLKFAAFAKGGIFIPSSGSTIPAGTDDDNGSVSFIRNAFGAMNRIPEYKTGGDFEYNNNVAISNNSVFAQLHTLGTMNADILFNVFLGQPAEFGGKIYEMSYYSVAPDPTVGGFGTGAPSYLFKGNWNNYKQFDGGAHGNSGILFELDDSYIFPQPTPIPERAPIGHTDYNYIIKTTAKAVINEVVNNAGAHRYMTCDGTWTIWRDRTDKNLFKEIKQGASYMGMNETQDGGISTLPTQASCADTNNNGLWDAWETRYSITGADLDRPEADPDGDGYHNMYEFLWGTNPNDSTSF